MMHSPYRDSPANSVADLQHYYDDGRPSTQDIPLTNTSRANRMDNSGAGYAALGGRQPNPGGSVHPAGENHWMERPEPPSKRAKWLTVGLAGLLIILIAVGVSVGVILSKKGSNTRISSRPGPSNTSTIPGAVNQTDPNDPSTFRPDSRLKRSFYGFAYSPDGAQLPDCGANLPQVITDIQLLSQLTPRIRLYGADCNQSALVLEAIRRTKVDMKVYLGNYPVPDDNHTAYRRQRDIIQKALQTYGTDHVAGITVGNEFMLNYVTEHGSNDPNSAIANVGADILIEDINDTRQMLASMGLTGRVAVGNSDAGFYFNNKVMEAIDYGLSNVHPWFGGVSIDDSAGWTWDFFNTNNVLPASVLPNHPDMYIAETGWPTAASSAATSSNNASIASEANLQIFLDTFVCEANRNTTKYFFFEFQDQTWKDILYGGVEGHWGIYTANRTLKHITIPDCPAP